MDRNRVLVIEDNVETAKNIGLYLQHQGFDCRLAHSGSAGLAMMDREKFHLLILDVMLPDLNGFQVCEQIRAHSDIPIIMLTAKVEDRDLVKGLARGADDYVKKPYSNKELIARVKAHLRRYRSPTEHQKVGPFEIDPQGYQISYANQQLKLTKTEYQILHCLLQSPGRVYSRDNLCSVCFDDIHESVDRTIDVHVHNLRKKIVGAGLKNHGVVAVYGLGYKWAMP